MHRNYHRSSIRLGSSLLPLAIVLAASCIPASAQTKFQVVHTPDKNFNDTLFAASASAPDDIWAVGDEAVHYDGMAFTEFPAQIASPGFGSAVELTGVVDFSPTNAWAVGLSSTLESGSQTVIEQWNGAAWSIFPGPTFAQFDTPSLRSISGVAPNDIWAVGSLLTDSGQILNFLFEHYDGVSWTAISQRIDDKFLLSVSADASDDAWAVGFDGPENDNSRTLVMHWNGKKWSRSVSPSTGPGANQLNSVLALAPDNVWAVGYSRPVAPPKSAPTVTLIEHFDGASWSVVPSPNVGPTTQFQSNQLLGLTAVTPDDMYAFGSSTAADGSGQQFTLLEHWDGTAWTVQPSPNPTDKSIGFVNDLLFAGVVPDSDHIWLFGNCDIPPHQDALAMLGKR